MTPATIQARVVRGKPASAIARAANEMRADLVVVGVSRRSAIGRAVFGVTAARLLKIVNAPLAAVPEQSPRLIAFERNDSLEWAA